MPMITGPKEQSVLPDGSPTYQTSAGATPEAFGGGLAQGALQAGAAADNIAMRTFAIKNETDRVAAENELMSRTQDLQNGNKDKGIVGYRTLVGKNAVDALPDYQQKLQDAYKDVREGLNPAAARMFDQTAFRIVRGSTDSMGSYSAQQQVVGAHQEARSRVQLAQQGALTYADDPGGWDAHLSDVQEASLVGSRVLGLGPDATEEQRKRDVSSVFENRTHQLINRDPMEAAKFYHDNIGSIAPDKRYELERALKVTTDNQYQHADGQAAYQKAIGQPSAPAMPADKGSPELKPFDQKRIDEITAFVKKPSPYDDEIAAAAKRYNVNPAEIKLKIGLESSGNPKAVSSAGAVGLGQFMPATATQYGVTDRTDPVQSINGIAKMLASTGGTVGGDLSKADRAYIGNPDRTKNPEKAAMSDQYVENTRAVRQALFGGGAPAPLTAAQLEGKEADVIREAGATADARFPGNAAYKDGVIAHAHSNWARDVQALKGQDYANFSSVLDATVKSGATVASDLPPDVQQTIAKLSPQNLAGIHAQFDRNLRVANGEYTRSDPKLVNDTERRIFAADGDPKKITQPGDLAPLMGHGLNAPDYERLKKLITDANTPEGNPFLKQVSLAKDTGRKMLTAKSIAGDQPADKYPDYADEAAYRFSADVDLKIAAARKAGKDPQELFNSDSPSYVLSPGRVAAFMPSESDIAASKARALSKKPDGPGPGAAFASEDEAAAAAAAGRIKAGDRIRIGNQTGTWH